MGHVHALNAKRQKLKRLSKYNVMLKCESKKRKKLLNEIIVLCLVKVHGATNRST